MSAGRMLQTQKICAYHHQPVSESCPLPIFPLRRTAYLLIFFHGVSGWISATPLATASPPARDPGRFARRRRRGGGRRR